MFERFLAGVGSFFGGDGYRDVAGERDALFFRFIGDGEVLFTRQKGEDLHKIRAALFGLIDGRARLRFGRHTDRTGPERVGPVDDRAGDDQVRGEEFSGGALLAPFVVDGRSPHDANAGDAVGEEQREIIRISPVNMHVPKAGDEEFSCGVDDLSVFRDVNSFADCRNVSVDDDNVHVRLGRRAGGIDYGDVRERKRR